MRKTIMVLFAVLIVLSVTACQSNDFSEFNIENADAEQLRPEDFIGKRIGFIGGEVFDLMFYENVGDFTMVSYIYEHEGIELLKNNRADAIMTDSPIAEKWSRITPALMVVYPPFAEFDYGFVFNKEKAELLRQFNEFLAVIKENGVLDDIANRWIYTADSPPMPDIPLTGENGTLLFATCAEFEPFSFFARGQMEGFDVEIARRFAQYMGMDISATHVEWISVIPYINSGRADFGAGLFVINDERKEVINFSDPYHTGGAVLLTLNPNFEDTQSVSFIQSLKDAFERNLIHEQRWKMVVDGLQVSLIITFFAFALATLLGFAVCGLRMSKNPALRAVGSIYVNILRGTPIVVLLMITFYVIFARSSLSGTVIAVIAFGANSAAFVGEIIRSAISTIDKGQVEAARSMGFSKTGAFFTVTFPQAARVAFPVYMSEFVSLFKMTSVVGYIAIVDLTKAGDIIRSRTYDAFFPLIMVALVYLIAASLMIWLFSFINRKTNKRLRRGGV